MFFNDNSTIRKITSDLKGQDQHKANKAAFSVSITEDRINVSFKYTDYIPQFVLACFSQKLWDSLIDTLLSKPENLHSEQKDYDIDSLFESYNPYHERDEDGYYKNMPRVSGYS